MVKFLVNPFATFIVCLIFLTSCGPAVSTRIVDPSSSMREFRQDITSSSKFSPETHQAIRMANATDSQAIEEGVAFVNDPLFQKFSSNVQKAYVGSEIALARAIKLEKKNPAMASGYFLRAAQLAAQGGLSQDCSGAFDVRCDGFKAFYSRSILALLTYFVEQDWKPIISATDNTSQPVSYTLAVGHDTLLEQPQQYDFIQPSASIEMEGLTNRHHRWGVGLALTACRKKDENSYTDTYLPKSGLCLPLNAVLNFNPQSCNQEKCDVTFALHNALKKEFLETESGTKIPLQADFTAPFAKVLERSGIGGWDGLFDAFSGNEQLLKSTGFYSVEPYDPEKIPVITVHGLFSSPVTWVSLHNDLMGDPVLRKHFQVWHYLYPTNLPILVNAKTFREKLDELEKFFVTHGAEKYNTNKMLLISHSMGGLLTKTTLVPDSSPVKNLFVSTPEKLKELDQETRDELQSVLEFKTKPYIERVIFVAVPHRGSQVSDGFAGAIGRWLISLPSKFISTSMVAFNKARSVLNPKYKERFGSTDFTSVQGLSPSNPVLQTLAEIAVDERIPFHTIIGDRGLGNGILGSDGVVAYTSSHLEGAQSELIVPADHTAHAHPAAVQEIKRIMYLDLEQRKKPAEQNKTNLKKGT